MRSPLPAVVPPAPRDAQRSGLQRPEVAPLQTPGDPTNPMLPPPEAHRLGPHLSVASGQESTSVFRSPPRVMAHLPLRPKQVLEPAQVASWHPRPRPARYRQPWHRGDAIDRSVRPTFAHARMLQLGRRSLPSPKRQVQAHSSRAVNLHRVATVTAPMASPEERTSHWIPTTGSPKSLPTNPALALTSGRVATSPRREHLCPPDHPDTHTRPDGASAIETAHA